MSASQIEELFAAQKRVRDLYHEWKIDDAIREYDASILPFVRAVDPRVSRLATSISHSLMKMSADDYAALTAGERQKC